ncbi:FAD-dependent monooxygenase, partial [Flavobacterium sp. 3-210]
QECQGQGKINRGLTKKAQRIYKAELAEYERTKSTDSPPVKPKAHLHLCTNCSGSGLIQSDHFTPVNTDFPHVAIIGAGIGG